LFLEIVIHLWKNSWKIFLGGELAPTKVTPFSPLPEPKHWNRN